LRNSDSVANQAEQLPRSWPFLAQPAAPIERALFAGRPARRILVNGLQLRLLSSDLGPHLTGAFGSVAPKTPNQTILDLSAGQVGA
jgi:hypothetical protein